MGLVSFSRKICFACYAPDLETGQYGLSAEDPSGADKGVCHIDYEATRQGYAQFEATKRSSYEMVLEVGRVCRYWCLCPRHVLLNDRLGGSVPLDAGGTV